MSARLRWLGLAWMVWSATFVLLGGSLGLGFVGLAGLMRVLPDTNTGEPAPWWAAALFGGFGALVGLLFVLVGILGMVSGWALRSGRGWARVMVALLAFTQMSNVPLGTILGIVTFYILFTPEPPQGADGAGG